MRSSFMAVCSVIALGDDYVAALWSARSCCVLLYSFAFCIFGRAFCILCIFDPCIYIYIYTTHPTRIWQMQNAFAFFEFSLETSTSPVETS